MKSNVKGFMLTGILELQIEPIILLALIPNVIIHGNIQRMYRLFSNFGNHENSKI